MTLDFDAPYYVRVTRACFALLDIVLTKYVFYGISRTHLKSLTIWRDFLPATHGTHGTGSLSIMFVRMRARNCYPYNSRFKMGILFLYYFFAGTCHNYSLTIPVYLLR